MRRVLVALPNDTLGGAEQYLKNIAQYYCDEGFSITVLFLKKRHSDGWSDLENRDNVELIYTKSVSERYGLLQFCKKALKYRNIDFDFIFTSHVHVTGVVGIMIKLGLIKKKYFIGRESTSIFNRFSGLKLILFKLQYYFGYPALDLLVCQTDFMHEQFRSGIPSVYKKINVKTVPNPINLSLTTQSASDEKSVHYSNFIISAGRLIDEKGFDILIEAFAKLKTAHPDLNLVILGEGLKRPMLEAKIISLELENSVFLPGFEKNVYPFFKLAKLCVVSSRIEGFPNVLLQMMSQNNSVVSTLCAGGIEGIEGLVTCMPNSADDLYRAMLQCLSEDSKENRRLFDMELVKRSVPAFVRTINFELRDSLPVYNIKIK